MKKLIYICLMLFSITGRCEWTMIASGQTSVFYVDFQTIKRNGNFVNVWVMTDLVGSKKEFKSLKTLYQFDCHNEKTKYLQITGYSQRMGQGVVVGIESGVDWAYVIPGSNEDYVLKTVCKN